MIPQEMKMSLQELKIFKKTSSRTEKEVFSYRKHSHLRNIVNYFIYHDSIEPYVVYSLHTRHFLDNNK